MTNLVTINQTPTVYPKTPKVDVGKWLKQRRRSPRPVLSYWYALTKKGESVAEFTESQEAISYWNAHPTGFLFLMTLERQKIGYRLVSKFGMRKPKTQEPCSTTN